ncbi:multiheme c-type cytochrome [Magnetococcus sp. PR-3]|uniref:multiheme c-type cytochrome n=1 Tax=Magnetococcus sp. PR-3 TaxID=3120355 RepID=UPI002FCE0505
MKKRVLIWASFFLILFLGYSLYLHKDTGDQATYMTSQSCANCHSEHYQSWHKTLHPIMFLPVTDPRAKLLGDFASGDPAVTFKPEDVEFVVGSKWEQVYVRRIEGEYYPLPAKWLVMQKRWVPYKVKDWKETPMSYKCNGCHTTGFDPKTTEFSEFGIGCEACHGPGSLHVQHEQLEHKKVCQLCHGTPEHPDIDSNGHHIITSVAPSVCAQCHNRGTSSESASDGGAPVTFSFPTQATPGGDMGKNWQALTKKQDKKGKYWWGQGVSKNRHQEYADWNQSGHANALKNLHANYVEGGDRGKLSAECLHCHATDYRLAKEGMKPNLEQARHGVTCVACHNPHGFDKKVSSMHTDGTAPCADCHIDSIARVIQTSNGKHTPCPTGVVGCADCHMPRIVKTGGFFSLRSHAFRIIPPEISTLEEMPNSCQNGGCHEDRSLQWADKAFKKHYIEYDHQVGDITNSPTTSLKP